jgi:hypothetical protein
MNKHRKRMEEFMQKITPIIDEYKPDINLLFAVAEREDIENEGEVSEDTATAIGVVGNINRISYAIANGMVEDEIIYKIIKVANNAVDKNKGLTEKVKNSKPN